MYFSDDFINEVLERNDIVEVISKYVDLKKKGDKYWGLCPFHGEKTSSFCVNSSQQYYYCFGCHESGNAVGFVQKIERMDFMETIAYLADRVRLQIPKQNNTIPSITREDKAKMFDIIRESARYFHNNLNADNGKKAREYINSRGLTNSIVRRFGLGYALDEWRNLSDYLKDKGFDEKDLLTVGIAKKKEDNIYDAFRNRIMFPIIDQHSRVCGFGGRVMDKSLPKYINSQETPIFNKRYILYGIHYLHKMRSVDKVMIVEGYMDVIALHKAGFTNVVASLGTALTSSQAKLIKRYTDNIYICYDGDSAGQAATLRGLDILSNEGLVVKVMFMPDGMDPDDYANHYGLAGINEAIDKAKTLNNFKLDIIEKDYDLTKEEQRSSYLKQACSDVLAHIDSPVELAMYIKRLHMKTGFPEASIQAQTNIAKKTLAHRVVNNRNTIFSDTKPRNSTSSRDNKPDDIRLQVERLTLHVALSNVRCRNMLRENIDTGDFTSPSRKKLAKEIYKLKSEEILFSKFMNMIDEETKNELVPPVDMDISGNEINIMKNCIENMIKAKDTDKIHEINKLLKDKTLDRETRIGYISKMEMIIKNRANITYTENEEN